MFIETKCMLYIENFKDIIFCHNWLNLMDETKYKELLERVKRNELTDMFLTDLTATIFKNSSFEAERDIYDMNDEEIIEFIVSEILGFSKTETNITME